MVFSPFESIPCVGVSCFSYTADEQLRKDLKWAFNWSSHHLERYYRWQNCRNELLYFVGFYHRAGSEVHRHTPDMRNG